MDKHSVEKYLSLNASAKLGGVHIFAELDSTNSEAIRFIEAGANGTHLFIAEKQTAGRGRRGRTWKSPAGGGLYMSLLHAFPDQSQGEMELQALSLVTALAVFQSVSRFGAGPIQLKWPNDIVSDRQKLAGILLEMKAAQSHSWIVFGIGINYSLSEEQKAAIDRPVIDMRSLTTELPAREQLAALVCSQLLENIEQFSEQGFAPFQSDWNNNDRFLGAEIVIEDGARRIEGRSSGVDDHGALLVQTASGQHCIQGGEVFPSLREAAEVS